MLQSVPAIGGGQPRRLASFVRWTFLLIQIPGPGANTLYLAETSHQLLMSSDSGIVDGLAITAASGIVGLWWVGDLWAAGSQAIGTSFMPFIAIPGSITSSGDTTIGGFGTGPSVHPAAPQI